MMDSILKSHWAIGMAENFFHTSLSGNLEPFQNFPQYSILPAKSVVSNSIYIFNHPVACAAECVMS